MRKRLIVGMSVLSLLVAACSDGAPVAPGGPELSSPERHALGEAMVHGGAVSGNATLFAPMIFGELKNYGSFAASSSAAPAAAPGFSASRTPVDLRTFDGAGAMVRYAITRDGRTDRGVLYGLVGWQGLNTQAGTVERVAAALADDYGATQFLTTGSANFDQDGVLGVYADFPAQLTYVANSGTVRLTQSSFGRAVNCGVPAPRGYTMTCTVAYGTMAGDYGFTATKARGTGPETWTLGTTAYDLPAIRLDITLHD